ncbi:hypothetical protein ACFL6N_05985 [Thermodesulfobacteriota bacterium]
MKNYSIDTIGGVTAVRFTQGAGVEDILNAIDDVAENYLNDLRLWDISDESLNLTGKEIRQLAKYGRSRFLLPSKVAIVASEDLAYSLRKTYEVYKDERLLSETRFFRSDQKARSWLSRPDDEILVQ